jgi:hypothetical protein
MPGKEEVLSFTKITKYIRNAIVAHDLDTLKECVEGNDYDLNAFDDNNNSVLYFALTKEAPVDVFSFLLSKTNITTKKQTVAQSMEKFNDQLTANVILLLRAIQKTSASTLEEKINVDISLKLLNELFKKTDTDEKNVSTDHVFISWLLGSMTLDTSILELCIQVRRDDVLSLALAEIYKKGKNALPPLYTCLSAALKNNDAECLKTLLLYGAMPRMEDVESVTTLKTFIVFAQFGHAIGRYFHLTESVDPLHDGLKNACLVGAYNNDKPISEVDVSAILNTTDLVRSDDTLLSSNKNILARILTDWLYWFTQLENPLFVYELVISGKDENINRALTILKSKNKERIATLLPLLKEKLTQTGNQTFKQIVSVYESQIIPSLEVTSLDVLINHLHACNTEKAQTLINELPPTILEKLKVRTDLNFELVSNETDNGIVSNQITAPTLIILAGFIQELDDLLMNLQVALRTHRLNLINNSSGSLFLSALKAAVSLIHFFILIPLLSFSFSVIMVRVLTNPHLHHLNCEWIDSISKSIKDYEQRHQPLPELKILNYTILFTGIYLFLQYCILIVQTQQKKINHKDIALILVAIAAFYSSTDHGKTQELAKIADELFSHPNKRSTIFNISDTKSTVHHIEKAINILKHLQGIATQDLPSSYAPVSVSLKELVRLGDYADHAVLFKKANTTTPTANHRHLLF